MRLFWDKVEIHGLDECWPWTGRLLPSGYGQFRSGRHHGLPTRSHRVAYTLTHGLVPPGLSILHSCDNPSCCNPLHLRAGTHAENMRDMWSRGRQPITCLPGGSNSNSRLSNEQISLILLDMRSHESIANQYGVSRSHVSKIKRKERWAHVA
jgi:hypothetical protein